MRATFKFIRKILSSIFSVLSNSQLVLNILSVNALPCDMIPMSATTLATIQESISKEPSFCNINDLTKVDTAIEQQQQSNPWYIYEDDEENSKSTDALLTMANNEEAQQNRQFPETLTYSIIKENQPPPQQQMKSIQSSIKSTAISRTRSNGSGRNSNSTSPPHAYEPVVSIESLTDSQGYVDDFDESCALIAATGVDSNELLSPNFKRKNSGAVNKAPTIHRFSAGDADKIERGIRAHLSTRSLRES